MPALTSNLSFSRCGRALRALVPAAVVLFGGLGVNADDRGAVIGYSPAQKTIEGQHPIVPTIENGASYYLAITSPAGIAVKPDGYFISPEFSLPASAVVGETVVENTALLSPELQSLALSFVSAEQVPGGTEITIPETGQTVSVIGGPFTGPEQTRYWKISLDTSGAPPEVPVVAGNYLYKISTLNDWPAFGQFLIDGVLQNLPVSERSAAYINMAVTLPTVHPKPLIQIDSPAAQTTGLSFSYTVGQPALTIPVNFSASSVGAAPITSLSASISGPDGAADIDDAELIENSGTTAAGQGALVLSTRVDGTVIMTTGAGKTIPVTLASQNFKIVTTVTSEGAGAASADVSIAVNLVNPGTVNVAFTPAGGLQPSYSVINGLQQGITFTYTATSANSPITLLSATLTRKPGLSDPGATESVGVNPVGSLGTVSTGTGTFHVSVAGEYELVVSGRNSLNQVGSATATFTVNLVPVPLPTIQFTQPPAASYTMTLNGSVVVNFGFTASSPVAQTLSAAVQGPSATLTVGQANAGPLATGTGSITITQGGTYTVTVSSTNSAGTVSAAPRSFTVTVIDPSANPDCDLLWLPPISLDKVQQGGSVLPVKFRIECCGDPDDDEPVSDTSVVILVSKDGGAPVTYTYSPTGPNPPYYTINGASMYHLNLNVARGVHTYLISVFRFNGAVPYLVGSKTVLTR